MTLRMEMDMDRYDEPGEEGLRAPSSEKLRLVLADDDADTRNLLACLLRWEGYEVLEASDGVELLARLEGAALDGTPIDAIVADIKMPRLSGLDVLGAVGSEYWQTPFILITAHGSKKAYASARGLGATAVLEKPFPINRLDAVLRAALDGERRLH
jgi:CheY-like chemotaxis protein